MSKINRKKIKNSIEIIFNLKEPTIFFSTTTESKKKRKEI